MRSRRSRTPSRPLSGVSRLSSSWASTVTNSPTSSRLVASAVVRRHCLCDSVARVRNHGYPVRALEEARLVFHGEAIGMGRS